MSTATKSKTKSKITIKPLGDRVLVRRIEEKESIQGGIYIPDSAREKPQEAEVLALGSGKTNDKGERIAFEVKAGDRVLISRYGGTEVKQGDDSYLLVSEDDILGILL